MNKSTLLIWISFTVLLYVKAEDGTDDYNKLCLQCRGDNAFPDCPNNETNSILNITIYCQKAGEHFCTIGIVKNTEKNSNSKDDLICLIKHDTISLEELEKDRNDFKIISIVEQPMLPVPLLLQTTARPSSTTLKEDNESNIQIISISKEKIDAIKPNMSHMAIVVNTNAAASVADGENADAEGIADVAEEAPADVEPEMNPEEVAGVTDAAAEVEPEVVEEAAAETEADKEAEAAVAGTEAEKNEGDAPEAESDKNDADETLVTATEPAPDDAATVNEIESNSEKGSVDYQGDEAKSDAEVDEEAVREPTVAVASNGEVKTTVVPTPVTSAADSASGSNEAVPVIMNCFSCTSSSDANCTTNPEAKVNCVPLEGTAKNGCYTLVKVDTNTTTRGCISELTDEGMKYCKDSGKRCTLCYDQGCNNHLITSFGNFVAPMDIRIMLGMIFAVITAGFL